MLLQKTGVGMSLNTIYILVNVLALSGWLVLVVSMFSPDKVSVFSARIVPVVLAVIYTGLMFRLLPFNGGGFDSLANLAKLFAQPEIALVGWIHYLVADLFIGAWQVQTAKRENLSRFLIAPSLLLTFILGPLGLLFFLVMRYLFPGKSQNAPQGSLDTSNSGQ